MESGRHTSGVKEDGEKVWLADHSDGQGQRQRPLSIERELNIAQRNHKYIWCIRHSLLLAVLFVFFCLHLRRSGNHSAFHAASNSLLFDWDELKSSKKLNWTKCYDFYLCAKLAVPLDYADPLGQEASVAVIKSPSRFSPGNENYKGPILFNPGGPGGSGVGFVLDSAPIFRVILGDQFDFIGFDPRGVWLTTPRLSVFRTTSEAGAFYLQYPLNVNTSTSALGEAYAASDILGMIADEKARHIAQHISTPTVARDMLSIINADGHEKLQYWGFSYGTVLGATFAAMFPDKVERVVIDGVVDAEDYYAGKWSNNLRDTDAALTDVYQACVAAGPSKCALYENSTLLIQERVDKLLNKLKTAPLSLYIGSEYDVVGYSAAKATIFSNLYTTHGGGGKFMTYALAEIEKGNPLPIYALSRKRMIKYLLNCYCPAPGEKEIPYYGFMENTVAIACGDAQDSDESLDDIRRAYEEMAKDSVFADGWFMRAACSGWKARASDRFKGSFKQNTSHPLLLVGNTADPVTPVWNAHKMSEGFRDSVVLTQNSSGHCSIAATSFCTMKAIRTYFLNGTLPEKGTVCQPESSMFEDDLSLDLNSLSPEDQEILRASQDLQKYYSIPHLGSMLVEPHSRLAALRALIMDFDAKVAA